MLVEREAVAGGEPRGYTAREAVRCAPTRGQEPRRFDGEELLAAVAHELRGPLAAIIYALQVLSDRGDVAPAAREMWAAVERQAWRAARIVDDLNDACASSWNKLSLCTEIVDVAEVVERSVQSTGHLFAGGRRRLTVSVPLRPQRVAVDPLRLEQVLVNLLTNATKFTELGGHVELTVGTERGQVVLRVTDDGRGIAPHLLPRVFDPFLQGPDFGGRSSGLGLGLALVKALVELHGGCVEASSDGPGRGAEFVIRLPLSRDD